MSNPSFIVPFLLSNSLFYILFFIYPKKLKRREFMYSFLIFLKEYLTMHSYTYSFAFKWETTRMRICRSMYWTAGSACMQHICDIWIEWNFGEGMSCSKILSWAKVSLVPSCTTDLLIIVHILNVMYFLLKSFVTQENILFA